MKKFITDIKQDAQVARTKITLEGDDCPDSGPGARVQQIQMLSLLANTPDLHFCGFWAFQKLKMYHNGSRWVVELEASAPGT